MGCSRFNKNLGNTLDAATPDTVAQLRQKQRFDSDRAI